MQETMHHLRHHLLSACSFMRQITPHLTTQWQGCSQKLIRYLLHTPSNALRLFHLDIRIYGWWGLDIVEQLGEHSSWQGHTTNNAAQFIPLTYTISHTNSNRLAFYFSNTTPLVTASPSPSTSPLSPPEETPAIVYITIGIGGAVAAIAVALIFLRMRK